MRYGNGETRHPLVVALYGCHEGHMFTPPDRSFMVRQAILCPLCDEAAVNFSPVPIDKLPRSCEEYETRVLAREEIELYGRKEHENI